MGAGVLQNLEGQKFDFSFTSNSCLIVVLCLHVFFSIIESPKRSMNPITSYCLFVGCFWLAIFGGTATHELEESDDHPHKWEMLYLVHQWPVTVCKMNEHDCKEDPLLYWTIHGLWPDKAEDCNRTWHFNLSELQDLMGDMKKYWPDVLHPNHTFFWKHEWEKHGTCAAMLESLNSEEKYFSKALELYKRIDLNSWQPSEMLLQMLMV
uniref:Ribonuclease T2 n=1 Tax=Podarcis muralis TaxID=64176 RepID=A0A670I6H8_PODMU